MPRGDGTGPAGQGPRTGRGMGYCAGFDVPGFANPGFGRGRRFWGAYPRARPVELTKEQQLSILESETKALEAELKALKEKISELKK